MEKESNFESSDSEQSGHSSRAEEIQPVIDDFVIRIRDRWHRSIESILEVAELCATAMKTLMPHEYDLLRDRLPFGPNVFLKLAKVGTCKRFEDPAVRDGLPASYSTLYELTILNDAQFEAIKTDNVLTPDLKREQLKNWVRSNAPPSSKPYSKGTWVAIRFYDAPPEENLVHLKQQLEQLASQYRFYLSFPRKWAGEAPPPSGELDSET